jgi:hypothetical protein
MPPDFRRRPRIRRAGCQAVGVIPSPLTRREALPPPGPEGERKCSSREQFAQSLLPIGNKVLLNGPPWIGMHHAAETR